MLLRTQRQTDTTTTVTLAAHARRGLKIIARALNLVARARIVSIIQIGQHGSIMCTRAHKNGGCHSRKLSSSNRGRAFLLKVLIEEDEPWCNAEQDGRDGQ